MKNKIMWATSMVSLALIGCSVTPNTVSNRPPVIENTKAFAIENGELKISSISAFTWPESLVGSALRSAVKSVNIAAGDIDRLAFENEALLAQKKPLLANFKTKNCMAKFDADGKDQELEDDVTSWKQNIAAEDQELYQECVKNQDRRNEINRVFAAHVEDSRLKSEIILKTIDPDVYPQKKNYRNVSASDSALTLSLDLPAGVSVLALRGFVDDNNRQSLEGDVGTRIYDAKYDRTSKVLSFKVPEVQAGVPTGAHYEFALERADVSYKDSITNTVFSHVRFAGDMKYVFGFKSVAGSAKIDGDFSQP